MKQDDWKTFHRPIQFIKEIKKILREQINKAYGLPLPKNVVSEIEEVEKIWYTQDLKLSFNDFQEQQIKPAYDKLYRDLGIEDFDINKIYSDAVKQVEDYLILEEEKLLPKVTETNINLQGKIIYLLAAKKRNEATEEIVKYLKSNNKFYSIRNNVAPEIWRYEDGIYQDNGISYIKETTRELFGDLYTSQIINNIVLKIEADCFIDADTFFNKPEIDFIAVENGIINIKTKELIPFTPDKIFFNKMPVKYNPELTCPAIINHFQTVLKNPEDILTMQELFGDLLRKENKYEKGVMFNGFGRNGKSKTLSLIKSFMGELNCSSISLQQLEEDQYAIANLQGKMVNLAGDLSRTALKNTGNFKNCIGRDSITANRKNRTHITFVNYAKMLFACNELPITYDNTEGFWSKWLYFDFPYKFISKSEYETILEDEKLRYRVMNEDILTALTTPNELSGLLNWSLEGLHRLDNQHRYSDNKTTDEIKMIWLRKSNSLKAFCMDFIHEDYDSYITKKEFAYAYSNYCRANKLNIVNDKYVKDMLLNEFGVVEERPNINGERTYVWQGIKFKASVYPVQDVYPFSKRYDILNSIAFTNTPDRKDSLDQTQKSAIQNNTNIQNNSIKTLISFNANALNQENQNENSGTNRNNRNCVTFSDRVLVHLPCCYPKGCDNICGKMPCNDLEGINYCQEHFEVMVMKLSMEEKIIDLRGV